MVYSCYVKALIEIKLYINKTQNINSIKLKILKINGNKFQLYECNKWNWYKQEQPVGNTSWVSKL